MIEFKHLERRRGNVPLRVARGHFATNHSHINYYIDITFQKTRLSEAKASAYQLVSHFINDTPVDTIVCLDGTAVLGACVAEELTKSGFHTINAHQTIWSSAYQGITYCNEVIDNWANLEFDQFKLNLDYEKQMYLYNNYQELFSVLQH